MTTKNVKIHPAGVQQVEEKKAILEGKIAKFEKLTEISKKRALCLSHIQKLESFGTEPQDDPTASPEQSITLTFSSNYKDAYTIQNPTLTIELRDFMLEKLRAKEAELLTQFLEAEI